MPQKGKVGAVCLIHHFKHRSTYEGTAIVCPCVIDMSGSGITVGRTLPCVIDMTSGEIQVVSYPVPFVSRIDILNCGGLKGRRAEGLKD